MDILKKKWGCRKKEIARLSKCPAANENSNNFDGLCRWVPN